MRPDVKYAIPQGYVDLNFALYPIVSGESGASRESFSAEQLALIEKAVGVVPCADCIYCMCYLGFRISEFLALTVKDYDPLEKVLIGGAKTETGKNRVVTISPKIQDTITGIIADRASGAFFCNKDGKPFSYTTFRDTVFYPALEQIGHASPEMLRYYQDVDLRDLREITDLL